MPGKLTGYEPDLPEQSPEFKSTQPYNFRLAVSRFVNKDIDKVIGSVKASQLLQSNGANFQEWHLRFKNMVERAELKHVMFEFQDEEEFTKFLISELTDIPPDQRLQVAKKVCTSVVSNARALFMATIDGALLLSLGNNEASDINSAFESVRRPRKERRC